MSASLVIAAVLAAGEPAAAAAPEASAVEGVEVTARAPIVGDLQKGTLNYRPEYFEKVRPSTAIDMVTWLPGFVFEDTRDMRGLGGSTGNVLIDGKPPTSKTDTLQSVLKRIPAEQVERVDLIVGGAPGIDMRGRSVIANVILKGRSTPKRVVTMSSYIDPHGRATPGFSASTSQKRDGKVIEASVEAARNIAIFPGYGYGPYIRRDATERPAFMADTRVLIGGPYAIANGTYEFPLLSGRLRLNGSVRYQDAVLREVDALEPGPGSYSYGEDTYYRQGELGVRYERTIGRTSLETQVLNRFTSTGTRQETQRPPQSTVYTTDVDWREHVARVVSRFKRDDKLTLEAAVEGALNAFESSAALATEGLPTPLPNPDLQVTEKRGEVAATATWRPNTKFNLDTALKLESSTLTATGAAGIGRSFTYLKPKASFTWSPDKDTQIRLRGEREVGQLSFYSFVSFQEFSGQLAVGNPNLRPTRTLALEAVVERRFWNGGDLQITVRRRELTDPIDLAPVVTTAGIFAMNSNIGDGQAIDLIANLTVPLKRLGVDRANLKGVITRTRTRVIDPTTGVRRPLSGQPGLLAELHFTQDLPQWKLNWGIDAFYRGGSTFYRPFNTERLAAWPHVNVFVERRFKPGYTLRLEVQNLPGAHTSQKIDLFTGLRGGSPLSYSDEKRLSTGPLAYVRLRRSFE